MLIKRRAPRGARIRQQNIYMIRMLLHLFHQADDFFGFRNVSGDGDGLAGEAVCLAEGVEGVAGFGAGFGFARGDDYFGAAGLEEAGAC